MHPLVYCPGIKGDGGIPQCYTFPEETCYWRQLQGENSCFGSLLLFLIPLAAFRRAEMKGLSPCLQGV